MLIEGTTSVMIALGLHLDHAVVDRIMRRAESKSAGTVAPTVTSRLTDFGITLGIGAGLVVVKRRISNPRRSRREDVLTGLAFAGFGSAVSALIGFLASGGIKYADRIGLGGAAEYFVDYAADWKFWAVVIGGAYLFQGGKKLLCYLKTRNTVIMAGPAVGDPSTLSNMVGDQTGPELPA